MKNLRQILLCLGLASLLSACAMGEIQPVKKPVIAYTPATHDVHYKNHTVIPGESEETALKAFLTQHAQNPGGNIALASAHADSPQTTERLGDLQRLLREWGYPQIVTVDDPTLAPSLVRVTSSSVIASVPDCPDWSYAHMANYRNTTLSNFGCAHATNLVRMVENPNDLVAGSGDNTADAARSTGVIDTYRMPPAPPPSTGGASQTGGM